ncbi:MAG: hypothetical protein LV479_03155 [Methylacidiphilales bacterium]|nr:hypothetical protein [Candidatus Methylacidiphilales bacterium]
MSDERWLRFPIALLAYKPDDAVSTLTAILHYCLYTIGGSARAQEMSEEDAYVYAVKSNFTHSKNSEHVRFIRGASILGTLNGNCSNMVNSMDDIRVYLSGCGSSSENKANVSSEWFWRAMDTARGDGERAELRWRDFRFLCALLSKVGTRKFDRCGWQEIQARAAGWCGKAAMRGAPASVHKHRAPLILTQDQIRTTRDELEVNKFFCRVKYRTGGKGNGGESWYSFSTGDRAELLGWITEKKIGIRAGIAEKRAQDMDLIAKARTLPEVSPKSPRTLIGKGQI